MKSVGIHFLVFIGFSLSVYAATSNSSELQNSSTKKKSLFSSPSHNKDNSAPFIFDNQLNSKSNRFNRLWKQAKQYHDKNATHTGSNFIIGGRKASHQEFPSVVALVDKAGRTFCSGNLIAPNLVATAGHCVLNLFQQTSTDFKRLKKLLPNQETLDLNQLTQNIEVVVDNNKHNIHIRVAGKNYFDVVELVSASPSWTEWNADVANYYLTGKRNMRHTSNSVSDKAILRLSRSFKNIDIPEIVTGQELEAIKQQQYAQAIQVGFGYIKDPDLIEEAAKNDAQAKKQLRELMDKKYLVSLPINTVFNTKQGIRVGIGKPGKAACYGDSGGPTFVQLQNGEWRYLASLSKSVSNHVLCGENDASAWKESASEIKKQTTDIADVWVL